MWIAEYPTYNHSLMMQRLEQGFLHLLGQATTDPGKWQMSKLAGDFFWELNDLLQALSLANEICEAITDKFDAHAKRMRAILRTEPIADPELVQFRLLLFPEVLARALEIRYHDLLGADNHRWLHQVVKDQLRQAADHPTVQRFFQPFNQSLLTDSEATIGWEETRMSVMEELYGIKQCPTADLTQKIRKEVQLIPLQIMLRVLLEPTNGLPHHEQKRVAKI